MRRTSYTMDGFCLLYLLLILLMRSGDVETNPGPNTAESTISDKEFLKLAQAILPSDYNAVGISLGFSHAQLKANLIENLENYTNALLDVFMKWHVMQQPPHSNKRQLLADKLREIDLGVLSDRLLNEPLIPSSTGGPSRLSESQTKPPSAESQTKPLSPELVKQDAKDFKSKYSTVSDSEFLKLAKDIPPSYYKAVGISLGFPDVQLEKILNEKSKDYTEAFLDVFMKWNIKQQTPHSNKRQLLADELREIDLGGLSNRLLNEPVFPISTGWPSRLPQSQPPSAESHSKPLSPELVERCANDFKLKYRSTLLKVRADPLDPASTVKFDDIDTNLFLLEEHGTEKRMLDYNDILDLKVNGEFPKRIMVQGEGGAGKTTFCAKIAWDWIEGRPFSHFVWVLIVPLREFNQHSIGKIAKSYLAKNNPATVSQITEYIRSNPDKVFIAFDGLDEVSGKIMKTESCESQPTDQMQLQLSQPSVTSSEACGSSSETGDIGLVDILCSDQLASCPVLVTTRPWRAEEIKSDGDLMKLYTFIHVEGFNRENLSVYIHKYFPKNDDEANQLIQFISENDVISENMAHYPIYVAMLCLMWKEVDKQKLKEMKSMSTFSQIVKEMIAFLKEHYAQKEVKKVGSPSLLDYLEEIDELLRPIAKQALDGLLENKLVFGEDDFEICPESKDTACRVGILSQEDRITTSMDIHQRNPHVQLSVFFPQKLFQEYLAGVHLAFLYESDCSEFNRLIEQVVLPRKEEFRYLLYFTVSQNKSIATHVLNSMLQGLYINRGASQEQIDFIVDVAFESQDPDVAALVKDRVSSKEIVLVIPRDMKAHTLAGYAFIGPHVVELRIGKDCGPTISLDVAEIICTMPSLKKAFLHGELHHNFFATLAREGKESKVQTLKLHVVRCPSPASSHDLAEALCSMPNLTNLTLGMDLNEEFYSTLKANASSIQVQALMLINDKSPTRASSNHLEEALCSMPKLTDLTLGMDLNEEFYSTLKAKAPHIQLTKINTKTKWLLPEGTSSMSVNEPSGYEATPRRTETRDMQQTTEEIHAQYEFQAEGKGGRDGNQVHWNFLTDSPQELALQDNEAVISCGINFSPSGTKFSKPIKVTLDHNAHFSNPRHAEIVFYTRNKDSKSFERIPASTSGYPRCDVRAKDLDLFIDHFCDWWIVAKITRYFVGKRVSCTPYVQPPVRKESTHFVLLYIHHDIKRVIRKLKKEMEGYIELRPPQPIFVKWKHGDINIKLFDGPKGNETEIDEKKLSKKDLNRINRKRFPFEVKPLESGASEKILKFTLNQMESLSDCTLIQFTLPYDDMRAAAEAAAAAAASTFLPMHAGSQAAAATFPSTHAGSQAAGVLSQTDLVSDRILDKLSRHMPPGTYTTLCSELDIEYNEAKGILLAFNKDVQMATRDCLAQWKTRTGGNMVQLKEILQKAEVGDLVKHMYIK